MKKTLTAVLALIMLICFSGCIGVSGKNVTGITILHNMVHFKPRCPNCKHIGYTISLDLFEGENFEGTEHCEGCGEYFDIS